MGINSFTAKEHFFKANEHYKNGKYRDAEREYRNAIEKYPSFSEAHYNLGNLLLELNRKEEAKDEYTRALEIDSDFIEAIYNLGILLLSEKKYKESQNLFSKAIKIKPDDALIKKYLEILAEPQIVTKTNNKYLIVLAGILIFYLCAIYLKSRYYFDVRNFLDSFIYYLFANFPGIKINYDLNLLNFIKNSYHDLPRIFILFTFIFFIADATFFWGSSNAVVAKRQYFWISLINTLVVWIFTTIIFAAFSILPKGFIFLAVGLLFFLIPVLIKTIFQTTYGGGLGILLSRCTVLLISVELFFIIFSYK